MRDGDLVVPVYVSRPVSDVVAPARKLAAFTKAALEAGRSRTVVWTVPARMLAVTPGDIDGAGTPRVERGEYEFTAGGRTTKVTVP
ncbi:fibronectin type III-like domain-contianing protein [Streptomyces sp. NPDC051776]|uniref:fibronectin type III-like domain-contianing protein n=1 Tax=Streptomyces sp. NPDC051776 TaxID=3155414 RepID=UPI003440A2D0